MGILGVQCFRQSSAFRLHHKFLHQSLSKFSFLHKSWSKFSFLLESCTKFSLRIWTNFSFKISTKFCKVLVFRSSYSFISRQYLYQLHTISTAFPCCQVLDCFFHPLQLWAALRITIATSPTSWHRSQPESHQSSLLNIKHHNSLSHWLLFC